MDLYLPALPTVAADLGASDAAIALTMTAFLVGLGVGMLFSGSIERQPRDGASRCSSGLALYVLAAVGCALAPRWECLS